MKKFFLSFLTVAIALLSLVALAGTDPSNTFTLGDGAGSTKTFRVNKGAGNKPFMRWNNSSGKWEFSDDGVTAKEFGTGTGGGGGGGIVLNLNGGFEDTTTNWTPSAGTFTTTTTAANVGFGEVAGSWDASATGQFLSNDAVTVPAGLFAKVCTVSWYYKGGDSNLKMQVYDGTDVIAESSAFTAQTTYSAKQVLYFTCPSSGTIQARLASTGDAAIIYLDDVKLGQESVTRASPQVVSSGYFAGYAGFLANTSTSLGAFPTDSNFPGPTLESNIGPATLQTTDVDKPVFTYNNLPPGTYEVTFTARYDQNASSNAQVAISDGSVIRGHTPFYASTTTGEGVTATAIFSYASTGDRSFEVYSQVASGNIQMAMVYGARFSIKQIASYSGDETVSVDKMGWRIDANIGGANPSLGTSSVSSFTGITNSSLDMVIGEGSASAEIPCSSTNPSTGLTCSAGDESVGVVFTPPTAGTYEVCGAFGWAGTISASGVVEPTFQWVETANNAQTIIKEGGEKAVMRLNIAADTQTGFPVRVCGLFNFSDASKRTLRLFYEQDSGGTVSSSTLRLDRGASTGQRDMRVTVRRKVEFQDAVKFTNLVTTGRQAGLKIETASFGQGSIDTACSTDPCTLYNATPGITQANWLAAGRYKITFASNTWAVPPKCFWFVRNKPDEGTTYNDYASGPPTTTNAYVNVRDSSANGESAALDVMCVGW